MCSAAAGNEHRKLEMEPNRNSKRQRGFMPFQLLEEACCKKKTLLEEAIRELKAFYHFFYALQITCLSCCPALSGQGRTQWRWMTGSYRFSRIFPEHVKR